MGQNGFRRQIALALRKMPWLIIAAYHIFRLFQPRFTIGVVGVILNPEGQILLAEHIFHPRAPWGLVGGWVERNEEPANAICREIREELDLTIEVENVLLAELSHPNHLDIAYLCHPTGEIGILSSELLAYGWFDPHNLPRLHKFHYRAIQQALKAIDRVMQV